MMLCGFLILVSGMTATLIVCSSGPCPPNWRTQERIRSDGKVEKISVPIITKRLEKGG